MSNVSRRSFLKGLAAGTASIGALGLANAAGAMAFAETSGKGIYTPGTYTSVQSTDFATIEVKCTFSDTAITDVGYTLIESTSDDYFARMTAEAEEYCQKIVAAGSPAEVDGISGATLCTTALRVMDPLKKQYHWGSHPSYALTARYRVTPTYADLFYWEKRVSLQELERLLVHMPEEKKDSFDRDFALRYYETMTGAGK